MVVSDSAVEPSEVSELPRVLFSSCSTARASASEGPRPASAPFKVPQAFTRLSRLLVMEGKMVDWKVAAVC